MNEVEGGVNGVKIYTPECETAYSIERGIECYERFKRGYEGAPTAIFQPHSSGLDAALLDKARQDHVPVFGLGGGQAHAFEGRVFPYLFPLVFDYWSEASIIVKYIADRVGGYDKLKGVKLATLYLRFRIWSRHHRRAGDTREKLVRFRGYSDPGSASGRAAAELLSGSRSNRRTLTGYFYAAGA